MATFSCYSGDQRVVAVDQEVCGSTASHAHTCCNKGDICMENSVCHSPIWAGKIPVATTSVVALIPVSRILSVRNIAVSLVTQAAADDMTDLLE